MTNIFYIYKIYFMDIKNSGRTLDVFEAFAREGRALRLTELAALLHAPVSSCYQLIGTLHRRGYLYSLSGKSYYPTKRMLQAAETIAARDPVASLLGTTLEDLRDTTGESVILAQQADAQAIIIDVVESRHSIRYTARPGELRPLHSSAIGKALLSAMTGEERTRWLPAEPFAQTTHSTLRTRCELDADLERSGKRGWYVALGESVAELQAVAAPLHFAGSVFAIAIAGPAPRIAPNHEGNAVALLATIKKIENMLEKS